MIHNTAIIDNSVKIGNNVNIGPYCVITGDVTICDNVTIKAHVYIEGNVSIGAGTTIFPFASIGTIPQDLKYEGEDSQVIIGQNNSIREYVTINPGTKNGIMKTIIGDDNLLMINVHIAHDCQIGNRVIMANNATLAGHVIVNDNALIGGLSAVHQKVRIGKNAVVGGMSGVERDVIPYGLVKGDRAYLDGINLIGLRRANVNKESIKNIMSSYKLLFDETFEANFLNRIEMIEKKFPFDECVLEVINFLKIKCERSICTPR